MILIGLAAVAAGKSPADGARRLHIRQRKVIGWYSADREASAMIRRRGGVRQQILIELEVAQTANVITGRDRETLPPCPTDPLISPSEPMATRSLAREQDDRFHLPE